MHFNQLGKGPCLVAGGAQQRGTSSTKDADQLGEGPRLAEDDAHQRGMSGTKDAF